MKPPLILLAIVALGAGGAAGWYGRGAFEGASPLPPSSASSSSLSQKQEAVATPAPAAPPAEVKVEAKANTEAPVSPAPLSPSALSSSSLTDLSPEARAAAFREGEFLTIDLLLAVKDQLVQVEFRGNGRETMRMVATNRSPQPVRLSFPQGQAFESTRGKVTLLRPLVLDLLVGETRLEELTTVALASMNELHESTYVPIAHPQEKLQPLLDHLAAHREIPTPAAQTAVLALTENLPASAFAKFADASELPAEWNTTAFKVETVEMLQAMLLLRTLGYTDDELAITIDPQTRIEAMIDPLAHAYALQYYQIDPENEWLYWKNELLKGAPKTRHYALHGIAKYYPEVALEMLPQWVREARTSRVYRLAAVQALAMVHQPEALDILKTLQGELSGDAEFAGALSASIKYLGGALESSTIASAPIVGFRMRGVGALSGVAAAAVAPVLEEEFSRAPETSEGAGQGIESPESPSGTEVEPGGQKGQVATSEG